MQPVRIMVSKTFEFSDDTSQLVAHLEAAEVSLLHRRVAAAEASVEAALSHQQDRPGWAASPPTSWNQEAGYSFFPWGQIMPSSVNPNK